MIIRLLIFLTLISSEVALSNCVSDEGVPLEPSVGLLDKFFSSMSELYNVGCYASFFSGEGDRLFCDCLLKTSPEKISITDYKNEVGLILSVSLSSSKDRAFDDIRDLNHLSLFYYADNKDEFERGVSDVSSQGHRQCKLDRKAPSGSGAANCIGDIEERLESFMPSTGTQDFSSKCADYLVGGEPSNGEDSICFFDPFLVEFYKIKMQELPKNEDGELSEEDEKKYLRMRSILKSLKEVQESIVKGDEEELKEKIKDRRSALRGFYQDLAKNVGLEEIYFKKEKQELKTSKGLMSFSLTKGPSVKPDKEANISHSADDIKKMFEADRKAVLRKKMKPITLKRNGKDIEFNRFDSICTNAKKNIRNYCMQKNNGKTYGVDLQDIKSFLMSGTVSDKKREKVGKAYCRKLGHGDFVEAPMTTEEKNIVDKVDDIKIVPRSKEDIELSFKGNDGTIVKAKGSVSHSGRFRESKAPVSDSSSFGDAPFRPDRSDLPGRRSEELEEYRAPGSDPYSTNRSLGGENTMVNNQVLPLPGGGTFSEGQKTSKGVESNSNQQTSAPDNEQAEENARLAKENSELFKKLAKSERDAKNTEIERLKERIEAMEKEKNDSTVDDKTLRRGPLPDDSRSNESESRESSSDTKSFPQSFLGGNGPSFNGQSVQSGNQSQQQAPGGNVSSNLYGESRQATAPSGDLGGGSAGAKARASRGVSSSGTAPLSSTQDSVVIEVQSLDNVPEYIRGAEASGLIEKCAGRSECSVTYLTKSGATKRVIFEESVSKDGEKVFKKVREEKIKGDKGKEKVEPAVKDGAAAKTEVNLSSVKERAAGNSASKVGDQGPSVEEKTERKPASQELLDENDEEGPSLFTLFKKSAAEIRDQSVGFFQRLLSGDKGEDDDSGYDLETLE